jgi:nucleoid-associated protein Lsr2
MPHSISQWPDKSLPLNPRKEISMAQQVHVVMVDDVDGGDAQETVYFALDDVGYEIDLSTKNAKALRDALSPYVASARKVRGRRNGGRSTAGRRGRRATGSPAAADIRSWARENGYKLSDRGRVPSEVREAYNAAH